MIKHKTMSYLLTSGLCLLLFLLLSGCSNQLPKGQEITKSPWSSFEEVKLAYDEITLHQTTTDELLQLGFAPYSTPNVRILSYLDIVKRFSPNNLVRPEVLPPSVRHCLSSREQCMAYEARPSVSRSERVGALMP